MRKRIKLGFTLLVALLFMTGVISYLELARLNNYTRKVVDFGANGVTLSNNVLDAVTSIDDIVVEIVSSNDSMLRITDDRTKALKDALSKIQEVYPQNKAFGDLINMSNEYINVVNYIDTATNKSAWYFNIYKGRYKFLENSVKVFVNSTQDIVVSEVDKMKNNAYRAIMYGIAATATAIIIILFFYFLINVYYITPIVNISKALKNYLTMRIPFDIDTSAKDEVFMIKEYIDQLIIRLKSKKD